MTFTVLVEMTLMLTTLLDSENLSWTYLYCKYLIEWQKKAQKADMYIKSLILQIYSPFQTFAVNI